MYRTLGEHGSGAWWHIVHDKTSAVLGQKSRFQCAVHSEIDLCRPWMCVWRVESARPEKANSHRDTVADEGGERIAVGCDSVARRACCQSGRGVQEVEDILQARTVLATQ